MSTQMVSIFTRVTWESMFAKNKSYWLQSRAKNLVRGFLICLSCWTCGDSNLVIHEVACTIVFNSNILHTHAVFMYLTALTINTDVFLNGNSLTNWSRLYLVQCGNWCALLVFKDIRTCRIRARRALGGGTKHSVTWT